MAYTRGRADRSGGKRQRANIKERQRIEIAHENLAHIRRSYRKLEEQNKALLEENNHLTEKLQLLEEEKE